jgi:hypothetical protein
MAKRISCRVVRSVPLRQRAHQQNPHKQSNRRLVFNCPVPFVRYKSTQEALQGQFLDVLV